MRPSRAAQGPGDSWGKSLGKAAVGVLVVAEIAFVVFLVMRPDAPKKNPPARLNVPAQRAEVGQHSNEASGLDFEYPSRWDVKDDGTVSAVTSPNGDDVISIGPGPSRDALTAMEEAQAQLEESYPELTVARSQVKTIESRLAITVLGRVVNDIGARLNFAAVSIELGDDTVLATEFDDEPGRPAFSDELRQVLESLKSANGRN